MNLHDKTPQQLNKTVCKIKGVAYKNAPDYCGDDALAFGLMVDNGIHANPCELSGDKVTRWSCHKRIDQCVNSATLNRAIVECFILMNQNKEV